MVRQKKELVIKSAEGCQLPALEQKLKIFMYLIFYLTKIEFVKNLTN